MGIRLGHHFPREFPIRVPGQQLWRGTLGWRGRGLAAAMELGKSCHVGVW